MKNNDFETDGRKIQVMKDSPTRERMIRVGHISSSIAMEYIKLSEKTKITMLQKYDNDLFKDEKMTLK